MKASDIFVKALENEGVEYIFGVPGEENIDLLESIRKSNIKLIVTRHEQGAGFMAATYGRLTGKAGVVLSTLGPGATNLVTPAAYAQLGAMPMVMLTGQKPITKSKQARFQIIDVVDMMRPITKFTKQIVNAANISSTVREAFRLAQQERPGATHIELPEDIAASHSDERIFLRTKARRPKADKIALETAADIIQKAKMPLILIGADANRSRTGKALTEFIDKTGIPFFDTQMGKGIVDECHPLFLGTAALSDHDYLHCAIERADLIINIGHDVIEKPPFFMSDQNQKQVIHVNFYPAQIDSVYFPQTEVVGDIAAATEELSELVNPQVSWDFEYYKKLKKEIDSHLLEETDNDKVPVLPQHIVFTVRGTMPEDSIVALDNGMYKIWFARNYHCRHPNTMLLDNALASMGAGLPSAMAAKMVHPEKEVMAVVGDGGFMMNSQEMETAVRLNLDLTVLIINDSGYGMIKWKQAEMNFDNFGLEFKNPDFVKYAESYGAKAFRVKKPGDLEKYIKESFKTKGVKLIDVPVDYSENVKLTKELEAKTCIL
jgi:acetolactate synthase I/II/III large subunit